MVKDTETTTTTEGQAAVILPVQIEPSDDHQTTDTQETAVESDLEVGQFSLFLGIFHQNFHYSHANGTENRKTRSFDIFYNVTNCEKTFFQFQTMTSTQTIGSLVR